MGGDAGVGKSRLVRDLKQEATARHIRVIEGRCSSTESSVPYAPFMDALRFRIARGEGEEVAKALGPLRAILAPIFPQLEGASAAADHATDRDRERPYALIFGVLERLASDDRCSSSSRTFTGRIRLRSSYCTTLRTGRRRFAC